MDTLSCNVIYVNRCLSGQEGLLRAESDDAQHIHDTGQLNWKLDHARQVLRPLLDAFGGVHLCKSGTACLSTLLRLQDGSMTSITPTLVLIDTPFDDQLQDQQGLLRTSSSSAAAAAFTSQASETRAINEELYGLGLLQKVITESHLRSMSKLVVPVPVISCPGSPEPSTGHQMTDGALETLSISQTPPSASRRLIRVCLDIGAVDVLISPLSSKCITTLEVCAYRAHRDAVKEQQAVLEMTKGRKRSWVGVSDQKPFAYLREAMVSGLMNGICRLDDDDGDQIPGAHIAVSSQRQGEIAHAVGQWHFCAHSLSDDELLVAALIIFEHALAVPELEAWRLSADQLIRYLVACRAAYNSFVPYHNFRHVVDVLQATFSFLVHIAALPPLPPLPSTERSRSDVPSKSPIAALLSPFEALTLLITAIGHDVGHPGVNNGFLATLNAPLAQLYNDRSVLESFHCAAYSQILRRYWPSVFEDRKMRSLMISSILATDMGLHFDYMKKLGDTQGRLREKNSTDGWTARQVEDHKSLACSLLIKCADISNVARHHETALKWMYILSEEFSRQASMEEELEIKSSLLSQPKKDMLSLSIAQLGFMNMFAIPLFQGVAEIMPAMRYTVDELVSNKNSFEKRVQAEKASQLAKDARLRGGQVGGSSTSPRNRSPMAGREDEHQTQSTVKPDESLPALTDSTMDLTSRTPQVVVDVLIRDDQKHVPLAPLEPADVRSTAARDFETSSKDVNGTASPFDAVRRLAESDPFNCRSRGDSGAGSKSPAHSGRQRCSETTDGSTSGTFAGDWQSQATTATTGKAALSPSTQGTSIVSSEAVEPTLSATGLNVSPPSASSNGSPGTILYDGGAMDDDLANGGGGAGKADGKALKKRSSRFRMRDFPFFRRSKTSSPPLPASDATS